MSPVDPALAERVAHWIANDPDPATRGELADIVSRAERGDQVASAELSDRFSGHLSFGTAGLRGALGAGPMRMNRVVVGHAARGLGRFLLDHNQATSAPTVVIGFDARHNSDVFARDTAEILTGLGIRALLFDTYVPTPVLAFAVRHLDASAGVMVTASHNPPQDNGYKVYLGGRDEGSQIVPPSDSDIHRAILASHAEGSLPALTGELAGVTMIGEDLLSSYVDHTVAVAGGADVDRTALRVCYTPLHGVGGDTFSRLVERAGFRPTLIVSAQAEPDPTFPTVAFPNPEEPGALDLAIETASTEACDLVVAHDPDADRLAVAVPDRSLPTGWRMLTGNELGVLLLTDLAEHAARQNQSGTLATSLVSTPIIGTIASHNGLDYRVTPTGFKWISRVPGLVGGFEEALGYLVNPDTVRDKDGLSAGLYLLGLAHRLHARGVTLSDRLTEIAREYGGFASGAVTLRFSSIAEAEQIMERVRTSPDALLGGLPVTEVVDYEVHPPEGFPRSNIIVVTLEGGSRVVVRPSGTEPKLKLYLDALAESSESAHQTIDRMTRALEEAVAAMRSRGEGDSS